MDTITAATDVDLYWEATGSGPAVLLIAGTPGDGGQFAELAQELATDHLVITYDRRGTSRSAAPTGWSGTTVAEQADDAADVLARVGVARAAVYGTSNGAAVALDLALRHPDRVQRAVLHEMPLLSVLDDPVPVTSAIGAMIGSAMEAGGRRPRWTPSCGSPSATGLSTAGRGSCETGCWRMRPWCSRPSCLRSRPTGPIRLSSPPVGYRST